MSKSFDPYYQWLGIRETERPPNHYRLLGIEMFESNIDVITTAADRQMAHLRTYRHGKNNELSERLLNEVSAAKVCLLDVDKKAAYDLALRAGMTPDAPPALPPESKGPAPESKGPEINLAEDDLGPTRTGRAKRTSRHYVPSIVLVSSLVLLVIVLFVQFGPFTGGDAAPDPTLMTDASDGGQLEPPTDEPDPEDPGPDEPSPDEPGPDDPPTEDIVDVTPRDNDVTPTEPAVPTSGSDPAPWMNRNEDSWKRPEFLPTKPSSAVLQAISLRNLDSAREMLSTMRAEQLLQHRDDVDQLRLLLYSIDRFWNAFNESLLAAREGDTVMYRGQPTQIVSIQFPTKIELEASNGQRRTFGLRRATVDRDLAIGMVELRFAGSPAAAWRLIGLFLATDRRGGDVDEGREYLTRAESHGFDGTYLLQVIDNLSQQKDRRVVTVPVETVDDASGSDDASKAAIPPKDAYDQKKREFRTLEPNPARWIETARRTTDDDVGRYVLLSEAARLAVANGNVDAGMMALDLLHQHYDVEVWKLRYEMAQDLVRKQKGAARRRLANQVLQLSHQAVMEDNYSEADRFAELAINIARSTRDKFFRDRLVQTRGRVQQIAKAYSDTRSAAELLKKSDDPAACTQVGEFLCFAKGDFANGLALLKTGQDAGMRKLATRDLAGPRGGADQVQLGDDWALYAESLDGLYQLHAIERARFWYEKSLRWLQPETARGVKDKLNQIAVSVGRAERVLDATRLYPVTVTVGYGKFGVNENPNLNDATIRALPVIDGRKISRYLWAHAPSKIEYVVPPGAKGFSAMGVFNDTNATDGAQFVVLVDGRQVFTSRTINPGQTVDVNAKLPGNARRIVLQVKSVSTYRGDQTYWVSPVFVF